VWQHFTLLASEVFAENVREGDTGHTQVLSRDAEVVESSEGIAHHGTDVVQALDRLVVRIENLAIGARSQTTQDAQHLRSAELIVLTVERTFLNGDEEFLALVILSVDASCDVGVVALNLGLGCCDIDAALLSELSNMSAGYIPTPDIFGTSTYPVQLCHGSYLEPEAGEKMVAYALEIAKTL